MRSLRTRITLMTILVLIVTVFILTMLSVVFIRETETQKSNQLLLLLCETGERNLDYYFNSVQKSVEKVSNFVESDLSILDDDEFELHVNRVKRYFEEMASKTNGVLTYYYRIDPTVSKVKGFWFVNADGTEFVEHEPTDISQYDTFDTSSIVWFTVPKYEGRAIWLPPYITENLGKRVISYNVPIYRRGLFIGVVGIEIDYTILAEQVGSIRLFENGYAFVNDKEGNLFYHPRIDVATLTPETTPVLPEGALGDETFLRYTFEGVDKMAAWLPLVNGMRLNVAVPTSEAQGDWQNLIWDVLIVAVMVLAAAGLFTMIYTRRITKPIKQLTEAASQVDAGNYDLHLTYDRDDEVGKLTKTFTLLSNHMKENITELNRQIYVDALTRVKNKGAFSETLEELQSQVNKDRLGAHFAIGVFDCDDLKHINDRFGHEKGDQYLINASRAICSVFVHSPVFRTGGDEFAIVLVDDDLRNMDALTEKFKRVVGEINGSTDNQWEQVLISMGIAVYDPNLDSAVIDVVRRADKMMYEQKRLRKQAKNGQD